MKEELAPNHHQKIGGCYVLWFANSNSYVVVSEILFNYLNHFLESINETDFLHNLLAHHSIQKAEASTFYSGIAAFLKESNSKTLPTNTRQPSVVIPQCNFRKYYQFGERYILINYASVPLMNLIHPQLEHVGIKDSSLPSITFDIFNDENKLYLFKDSTFINSFETKNPHLLQGKFAMELLEVLYQKDEAHWLATFHASTVCNDNEAIMIIGDSGNGKSTLSAILMAAGMDLLADDFTPMLAEDLKLYRYPAAISIKQGAFKALNDVISGFDNLPTAIHGTKKSEVKYVPPSKEFLVSKKGFPCHKIVYVKYAKDTATQLAEVSPEKSLQTLIPDSWISPNAEHSKRFLDWLKYLKFYELSYNDSNAAIEKFKELFAT